MEKGAGSNAFASDNVYEEKQVVLKDRNTILAESDIVTLYSPTH